MLTGILVFLAICAWIVTTLAMFGGMMKLQRSIDKIEQRMDVAFRCQRCHFPLKDGDVHGAQTCMVMHHGQYVVIQEAADSC